MKNSEQQVAQWIDNLSSHSAVPFAEKLRRHFFAGRISRLCDCGCNSFDLQIPDGIVLDPLCDADVRSGKFFEVAFECNGADEIACLFFADARGYLAGVEIMCGTGNHGPVPAEVRPGKVVYVI